MTGLTVTANAMTVPVVKDLAQAFTQGTSIRSLEADHPVQLMMWMQGEIIRTCQYLECKNTITNDNDALELADELIEQFPTMKAEEFAIVFKAIRMQKYGKYYERLKAGEFLECFRKHDTSDERIRMFEEINTRGQKTNNEPLVEVDYSKWSYQPEKRTLSDKFSTEEKIKRRKAMAQHIISDKEQNDLDSENHEATAL